MNHNLYNRNGAYYTMSNPIKQSLDNFCLTYFKKSRNYIFVKLQREIGEPKTIELIKALSDIKANWFNSKISKEEVIKHPVIIQVKEKIAC